MKVYLKVILTAILAFSFLLAVLVTHEVTLYTQKTILLGDVNMDGTIDKVDLDLVHQHLLRFIELDDSQKARADMNQDGEVNLIDLLRIHKYILGE